MKTIKFKRRVGALAFIFLLLLLGNAFALSNVHFPWSLNSNQIDYYWSTDTKTPGSTGQPVGSDPGAAITPTAPAHPFLTYPNSIYQFGGFDAPYAGSQSLYLRVWDNGSRPDGSHYTELYGPHTVPVGDVDDPSFSYNTFKYTKAGPGQALITSYVESKTVTNPTVSPFVSGTITFNSAQPTVGTYEVQIAATEWDVNGAVEGTSATFSKPAAWFTLPSYSIKVRHKSYFSGSFGTWSDTLTYSPGTSLGGAASFNVSLARPAGKGGVNFVIAPSTSNEVQNAMRGTSYPPSTPVTLTYSQVKTELELVNAINTIWGEQIVRTVGKWNPQTQQPSGTIVGYTSSSSTDLSLDFATTTALNVNLEKGAAYQVWLRPASGGNAYMSFTLQGK